MTHIIRHLAGPGAGKTTKLISFLRDEKINNGLKLSDFFFTSFSRTQTNDVASRISEIFPAASSNQVKHHVKTFHGLCWLSLREDGLIIPKQKNGSGRDEIIQEGGQGKQHFIKYAKTEGLSYSEYLGDPLDEDCDAVFIPGSIPIGNIFFTVSRFMTSSMLSCDRWPHAIAKMRIAVDKSRLHTRLFDGWNQYKRDNHLWEHDDYVRYALDMASVISPKVLFVDEFQDLSPLQYAVFCMWVESGLIETIFVAGDPNQAIYGFRGCNPKFLTDLPAVDTWTGDNRPISYRCPHKIVNIADQVLRKKSYIQPRNEEGSIKLVDHDDYVRDQIDSLTDTILDLERTYESVMILTRFKAHAKRISDELSVRGIPHSGLSEHRFTQWKTIKNEAWEPVDVYSIIAFLKAVENYRADVPVTATQVKYIREALKLLKRRGVSFDGHPFQKIIRYKTDSDLISIENVIASFPFPDRITPKYLLSIFRVPSNYRLTLVGIEKYLEAGLKISPDRIRLDTIHQSKGSESDAVVLFGTYLKGRVGDLEFDIARREEEQRIFYVGLTRAKKHLSIVVNPLLGGVCAPVLDPILSGGCPCSLS